MMIFKVQKENTSRVWIEVREYLDSALKKYGQDKRYPVDVLLSDILNGRMTLWVVVDDHAVVCAAVTERIRYPLGDAINIFLTGGKGMESWGDLLHDAMVTYAKEVGAKWIDTASRRGIGKKFYDRLGYNRRQENYSYDI